MLFSVDKYLNNFNENSDEKICNDIFEEFDITLEMKYVNSTEE